MDDANIPLEETPEGKDFIASYLTNIYKAKFNSEKNKWVYYDAFGMWERDLSREAIDDAIANLYVAVSRLEEQAQVENRKSILISKYADAINYFYNDARIDDNGVFISKMGGLKKEYFTMAELDKLLKDYVDLQNND
jgi:hypothetical protein